MGELAKTPEGNIIKLPNISASVPQVWNLHRGRRAASKRLLLQNVASRNVNVT